MTLSIHCRDAAARGQQAHGRGVREAAGGVRRVRQGLPLRRRPARARRRPHQGEAVQVQGLLGRLLAEGHAQGWVTYSVFVQNIGLWALPSPLRSRVSEHL